MGPCSGADWNARKVALKRLYRVAWVHCAPAVRGRAIRRVVFAIECREAAVFVDVGHARHSPVEHALGIELLHGGADRRGERTVLFSVLKLERADILAVDPSGDEAVPWVLCA